MLKSLLPYRRVVARETKEGEGSVNVKGSKKENNGFPPRRNAQEGGGRT